jgi:polyferredoxin
MVMRRRFLRHDVLATRPLALLLRSPWFPLFLQVLALVAVAVLAVLGWGHGLDKAPAALKLFRKTHLTTLAVWGLWWPGMIALALIAGRVWCTVCPMELVNRLGDGLARRFGWPRARMGRILRAGWMTLILYLILQTLVVGFALHRVPHYTALMLLSLFALALATGLIFRGHRSFCAGFCPASAILSVYGRFTPAQLSNVDAAVCDDCGTRDCVQPGNRDRFDRRSCPSSLRPYARAPSDGCVLCLQCVKVCPHGNMGYGLTRSDATVRRGGLLRPFEAGFVLVALGFVAHEVIGEVKWLDGYFHWVPERLHAAAPGIPFGWFEALWFLALFPLAVWAVAAVLGVALGHRRGIGALLLAAATGAAPVIAIAHLSKAVAKISAWVGYLPGALAEPSGGATFAAIQGGTLGAPGRLVGLSVFGWVMLLILVLVGWRAVRWARAVPAGSRDAALGGLATAVILFAGVLAAWASSGA